MAQQILQRQRFAFAPVQAGALARPVQRAGVDVDLAAADASKLGHAAQQRAAAMDFRVEATLPAHVLHLGHDASWASVGVLLQ